MKTITISGKEFQVTEPYAAGHAITEAEAKALNQVRAENIRNNMASKVKAAYAEEGRKEDDPTPETIGALVAAYDSEYLFTLASVGGGRKTVDPVESEANRIAKTLLTAALRGKGTTVKALTEKIGEDAVAAKIAEIAGRDDVVKEARKVVKAREAQQESVLDGLDL
jgi:hypothetical protein